MAVKSIAFREIKRSIYALRRIFGIDITVKRLLSKATNLETGAITRREQECDVRKAIVLSAQEARVHAGFLQGSSPGSSQGGWYDHTYRLVIMDRGKIDFEITVSMEVVIESEEYQIKTVETIIRDTTYLLVVQRQSHGD